MKKVLSLFIAMTFSVSQVFAQQTAPSFREKMQAVLADAIQNTKVSEKSICLDDNGQILVELLTENSAQFWNQDRSLNFDNTPSIYECLGVASRDKKIKKAFHKNLTDSFQRLYLDRFGRKARIKIKSSVSDSQLATVIERLSWIAIYTVSKNSQE